MKTQFEKMGGTYRQEGDYLLPDVEVPESPAIGIWGQWRHTLDERANMTDLPMLL